MYSLILREWVWVRGGIVASTPLAIATCHTWVVGEEEPVSKFEGSELPSNDAPECGTHISSRYHVLSQPASKQIDVAG